MPENQCQMFPKYLLFSLILSRELEYQLLEQSTVDTGATKGQSLTSVMGKISAGRGRLFFILVVLGEDRGWMGGWTDKSCLKKQ